MTVAERKMTKLGSQLRAYREAAGLSQSELAQLSGVTREYISAIEIGRIAIMYPEVFVKLHRALQFPAWELLEAMGYPTDISDAEVKGSLALLLRRLTPEQQDAVEALVRANLRASGNL